MGEIQLKAVLKNVPLFREMSDEHLAYLAGKARIVDLARGAYVFHKGDHCHGFYVTVQGNIKISFLSSEGKEHVARIVGPGQTFAEAVAFTGKACPASVQAISPSQVLFIPKEAIYHCLEKDPACARSMLAGLSRRLHHLTSELELVTLLSSHQRVIGYLLQHQDAASGNGGSADIKLNVSKTIIAAHLNLTPETLSRVLHSLSEQGLIRIEGKTIHINDIEKLRAFGA